MTAPSRTDPAVVPKPRRPADEPVEPTPTLTPTPERIGLAVRRVLTDPEAGPAWAACRAAPEPDPRPLYARLGARRLLAPAWPVAYGGRGLTAHHQAAVVDALVECGVPETLHTLSVQIAGTFLLAAGSRAQRATLLPGLAAGRSFCTVVYSEPEVGSDLAALTTTAERDPQGGGWRLTGRKVYSVKTGLADLGLVAARTPGGGSRYQGITLFCVPLATPGVTVRGLPSIGDEHFADVTFDGVLVPDATVIGPVGEAWPLITDALALERTGIDYHAKARRWLALWRVGAQAAGGPAPSAAVDAARLECRVRAARRYAAGCLDQMAAGRVDPVFAALTKLWCAETARDVAWFCAQESTAPVPPLVDSAFREAPGLTISAGTSEMMLELVAGSGLPAPGGDLAGVDEEPLARQLRAAVRRIADEYDDHDDPAQWRPEAEALGLLGLELPVERGGLGLGLAASVIACEELGRGLLDGGLLDAMAAGGQAQPAGPAAADPATADNTDTDNTVADPRGLARQRIRRAAWLVGLAIGALTHTVRRARERQQFGRPIVEHQAIAFTLARCAAQVTAGRLLVAEAAGGDDPDPAVAATTLAAAIELAHHVTREAMQLSGAWGMTLAAPVQRFYRAALAVSAVAGPARRLWLDSTPTPGGPP